MNDEKKEVVVGTIGHGNLNKTALAAVLTPPTIELTPEEQQAEADAQLEAEARIREWQEATYLLLGVFLHKHKRRAVDISPREIEKFAAEHSVSMQVLPGTSGFRYTVNKKKKAK